jgi:hypothetical protein
MRGHDAIVVALLDKGADVNALGGEYGIALQAASAEQRGIDKCVSFVLPLVMGFRDAHD